MKSLEVENSRTAGRRLNVLGTALGPFLALALVAGFFAIADSLKEQPGNFLSVRNLRTISVQTATVAVAALGMTVVIISGGIDLSAGTALALSLAWGPAVSPDWSTDSWSAACGSFRLSSH
jgi:ribose/xylose/arabinose/galactoside ABC-type transport system permease subunit